MDPSIDWISICHWAGTEIPDETPKLEKNAETIKTNQSEANT